MLENPQAPGPTPLPPSIIEDLGVSVGFARERVCVVSNCIIRMFWVRYPIFIGYFSIQRNLIGS